MWRAQHPEITRGFRAMKEGAQLAIQYPGKVYKIPNGKVRFKVEGRWLYMRLPSGRKLAYYEPEVDDEDNNPTIYFKGVDTETRQWTLTSTYGGKLVENAVQATARDLLVHGMFNLERAGYTIIGHIHDEAVSEIDPHFGSIEHAGNVMCDLPEWAAGLPVKYAGWRAKRFKKE
jgi:DNA polymerase